MARQFVDASAQYAHHTASAPNLSAVTMSVWFNPSSVTGDRQTLLEIAQSTASQPFLQRFQIRLDSNNAAQFVVGSGSDVTVTGGIPTTGAWSFILVRQSSSTSRSIFLNGTETTNATSNVGPGANADSFCIGAAQFTSGFVREADCRIAFPCIWDVALTDAEEAALRAGIFPTQIRPESLVAFWPLTGGNSVEPDWIGGRGLTLVNSPAVAVNPRIILPRYRRSAFAAVAVDVTAPELVSASINVAGDTLTLVFDENVTGQAGFRLRTNGRPVVPLTGSGDGTDTHSFALSRTVFSGETLTLTYSSIEGTAADDLANALVSFEDTAVTNSSTATAALRPAARPTYIGKKRIDGLTAIAPKITCCRLSGMQYFALQVSAEQTTCTGVTDPEFDPYFDLDYSWNFGDASGTETFTDWYTDQTVNVNTSQKGPEAAYFYRASGSYTVTLTVKGIDQYGDEISASTTTVLRLGEYQYFDGGATSGTWTITVDGQTTANINFDASTADIVAAVAALSSVGAGNVRDTGYGSIQFCGSLAGEALVISADFTGLVGEGAGDNAPILIERFEPGSSATIEVSDLSSLTEIWFDSNAAGGGDGTELTPFNDITNLRAALNGDGNDVSDRLIWIARGSEFAMTNRWFIGREDNNIRCMAYGTGHNPILRDINSAASSPTILQIDQWHAAPSSFPTMQLSDIAFIGIEFVAQQSVKHPVWISSSINGTTTQPLMNCVGVTFADCQFRRTGGTGSLLRVTSEERVHGQVVWNTDFDVNVWQALAAYNPGMGAWLSQMGGAYFGNDGGFGGGSANLNHHIYPKYRHQGLWRYIDFQDSIDINFCFNTTSGGDGACLWHLIDGCSVTGTSNGIDFSNVNNDYVSGDTSYCDKAIVQFNRINSGNIGSLGQENGVIGNNIQSMLIQYNDFWDNIDSDISVGDSLCDPFIVRFNNFYSESYGFIVWQEDGQLTGNHFHCLNASDRSCIRSNFSLIDMTTWDADQNTLYAPNVAGIARDTGSSTFISFANWQSIYGHDPNGENTDPLFIAPTTGYMEYSWPTPAYENTADVTDPEVISIVVNSAGTQVTVAFSEPVTGQTGFTLNASGGAVTLTPLSGDGTSVHVYSLSRVVDKTEDLTFDYSGTDIVDSAGNELQAFSGRSVIHNGATSVPGAVYRFAALRNTLRLRSQNCNDPRLTEAQRLECRRRKQRISRNG